MDEKVRVKVPRRSRPKSLVERAFEGRQRLLRSLIQRLRDRHTAEDVLQEAFLRVLEAGDVSHVDNMLGYLTKIAHRVQVDLGRRKKCVEFDSEAAERGIALPPEQLRNELEDRLLDRRELESVLARLPSIERQILLMHHGEGLSHAQIAQELNLTVNTVAKYCSKACAKARTLR